MLNYKKIMILDTSSSYLFINFIIDGKVEYEVLSEGKNNHSDNLLNYITDGLKKLNLQVRDFDCIICGKGPGMYTGLRVAMTVAKTFAWTLDIPLYTVSSLDLLTSNYLDKKGKYAVMMKAKKEYSYTKIFEVGEEYKIIKEEEFLSNADFLELNNEAIILDNTKIDINALKLKDEMFEKVSNIHALEPNYLRSDI